MRIAESFCKMRLSEYCSSLDIDRAIAVTVDSFIGSQKVSCKKALSRAFAKYVSFKPLIYYNLVLIPTSQIYPLQTQAPIQASCGHSRLKPSPATGSVHRPLNSLLKRRAGGVPVAWFLLCLIPSCLHFMCAAFMTGVPFSNWAMIR